MSKRMSSGCLSVSAAGQFDEAWAAWDSEVRARVQAELLLDDFERRVAELWERSERSRLEMAAR